VRAGVGQSGENPAYVLNTHRHLVELSVRDPVLTHLVEALALDEETGETEITDVE
jgi:cation transport protein ChaC